MSKKFKVFDEKFEKSAKIENEEEKPIHEKYGSIIQNSSSSLANLISIHYLKTMWSLGVDTELRFQTR